MLYPIPNYLETGPRKRHNSTDGKFDIFTVSVLSGGGGGGASEYSQVL